MGRTADWREGFSKNSRSEGELEWWRSRLEAANLLNEDRTKCAWDCHPAVPSMDPGPGDGTLFWSNKVHRGPATRSDAVFMLSIFLQVLPFLSSRQLAGA